MATNHLTREKAQLLRDVLGQGSAASAVLVNRLANNGLTRTDARSLVKRAGMVGLLTREAGSFPCIYRLNLAFDDASLASAAAPTGRPVYGSPEARDAGALAYQGPAFDRTALTPSVGLICNDVPPPEVAAILDHLDRRFYEFFRNVE